MDEILGPDLMKQINVPTFVLTNLNSRPGICFQVQNVYITKPSLCFWTTIHIQHFLLWVIRDCVSNSPISTTSYAALLMPRWASLKKYSIKQIQHYITAQNERKTFLKVAFGNLKSLIWCVVTKNKIVKVVRKDTVQHCTTKSKQSDSARCYACNIKEL